jgi:hypothetical protein
LTPPYPCDNSDKTPHRPFNLALVSRSVASRTGKDLVRTSEFRSRQMQSEVTGPT